jgi:hypothetical protein
MFPAPDAPKMAEPMKLGGPAPVAEPSAGTAWKGALQGFSEGGLFGAIGGAMDAQDKVTKQNELYQTLVSGGVEPRTAQLLMKQPEAYNVIEGLKAKREENAQKNATISFLKKKHGMTDEQALAVASNPAALLPYLKPVDRKEQLEIQKLEQEVSGGGRSAKRLEELEKLGIDPNSAEGIIYQANGKLPESASKEILGRQQKAKAGPQVAAGLKNLNDMIEGYDETSLESAIGPWQGADPDQTGLLSAPVANVARGLGEAWNFIRGGENNLSEIRSNIRGTTEALAAAIKPLIRGPGEGVWTDADQARLVSIVGDLSQASDKQEFKRRLNAVRDRITSNFGIEVPFDALGGASAPGQLDGSALQGRGNQPLVGPGASGRSRIIGVE